MHSTMKSALCAMTIVVGIGSSDALALSKDDLIGGKWCGESTNYQFGPNSLFVEFYSDRRTKTLVVESYVVNGDVITMNFKSESGEDVWAQFGGFNANRTRMVQLPNEAGPRRSFRRC